MTVMDYRTRDGLADYGFSIEFQPDEGWRVYIIFQPFRDGDSLHLPYQCVDHNGRRYVDWLGKLDSLGEAKMVAELWAELIEPYRRAQEQKAVYAELIEHYRRGQERRRAASPDQDHLDGDVDTSRSNSELNDCDPAVQVTAAAES